MLRDFTMDDSASGTHYIYYRNKQIITFKTNTGLLLPQTIKLEEGYTKEDLMTIKAVLIPLLTKLDKYYYLYNIDRMCEDDVIQLFVGSMLTVRYMDNEIMLNCRDLCTKNAHTALLIVDSKLLWNMTRGLPSFYFSIVMSNDFKHSTQALVGILNQIRDRDSELDKALATTDVNVYEVDIKKYFMNEGFVGTHCSGVTRKNINITALLCKGGN